MSLVTWKLENINNLHSVTNQFGVGWTMVMAVAYEVCNTIFKELGPQCMCLGDLQEVITTFIYMGLLNYVGAIDGTRIPFLYFLHTFTVPQII